MSEVPIIDIRGGSKEFGGLHAIRDVDFTLFPGEIHALVGENGAGKSTLCKAIAGAIQLSSGTYAVDGKPVRFRNPGDALGAGIGMIYQETSLVPNMTVAQNLVLGNERMFNNLRVLNIEAQQILQSLNFHVEPSAIVSGLGTANRQMVEIARVVNQNARVIIFDEPTASLTPEEQLHFFHLIGELKAKGVGIIYISHALEESLRIADRISVLRDGRLMDTRRAADFDRDSLVRLMVGRDVAGGRPAGAGARPAAQDGATKVLSVENVTMGSIVKNMSFSAYAGEVVGIAGLIGSGRTEIAKIIAGALKRDFFRGGKICLDGRPVRYRVPKQAIDDGIVYITEDRKIDGFFETMTVNGNIQLGRLATKKGFRALYSTRDEEELGTAMTERLSIRAIGRSAKISELSGGNQQKVVIAKSLVQEPRLIIFDEPTRGVDVGAIPQIHQAIRELAARGIAVVVISSYLPEILSVSDRILVAKKGRIVEEMAAASATEAKIMYAAVH